ncbi:MAG: signal recognition particle-docking protein FtsY [Spirochaetaceae bacterium]|jgi:fused signal recognition particle receptor|nr:signal recognition particle-docking protein FtsY [Spirochaetaceae bacterium]
MAFSDTLKRFFGIAPALDDDFFDGLADTLVEGDFGAELAFETADELRRRCKKENVKDGAAARQILSEMLAEILRKARSGDETGGETAEKSLRVILLLGVNGVGKTTTAAKLAFLAQKTGKTILAAADTFRAAAIDQLKIHGERLGIRVIAHKQGGDPAAVVYDALAAAVSGRYATVIADTAGRMHTKTALVEELRKIDRAVQSGGGQPKDGPPPVSRWLVLDATTGSNAVQQAETFHEAVKLDGVILTKTDSGAKGGVVFPLAAKLRLPVLYLCNGEKYENIRPFNADDYVREFLG